jgi:hypothetical protein
MEKKKAHKITILINTTASHGHLTRVGMDCIIKINEKEKHTKSQI